MNLSLFFSFSFSNMNFITKERKKFAVKKPLFSQNEWKKQSVFFPKCKRFSVSFFLSQMYPKLFLCLSFFYDFFSFLNQMTWHWWSSSSRWWRIPNFFSLAWSLNFSSYSHIEPKRSAAISTIHKPRELSKLARQDQCMFLIITCMNDMQ